LNLLIAIGVLHLAPHPTHAATILNVPDRKDYAFDNNGILYISTAGGNIIRYNTSTGSYLTPIGVGGTLNGIDLSPDGRTLAVADSSTQGVNNRVWLVSTATGAAASTSFVRQSAETGTNMVAWGSDNQLLVTSNFGGSGWVPLRRYNPQTNSTTTIGSVRQSSMLTPAANRNTIAIAESNISTGPITDYSVTSQSFQGTVNTGWFTFEVAVDRDGKTFVVPTGDGAFVYKKVGTTFQQQGLIGEYASHGPLAAVFSPVHDVLFTSEWAWSGPDHGVRVYDANTMSLMTTIDPYTFQWNGGFAMGSGRMEISPDGHFLAVSVDAGVRLYDVSTFVPEPSAVALMLAGGGWVLLRRSRRAHLCVL
jgi:dipeptidyl aminopeptidase/acylaminoacyl peptidase